MNFRRYRYLTRTAAFYELADVLVDVMPVHLRAIYVMVATGLAVTGNIKLTIWDTKVPVGTVPSPSSGGVIAFISAPVIQGGMVAWEPPECERVALPDGNSIPLGPSFEQGLRVRLVDDADGSTVAGTEAMFLHVEYVKSC